MALIPTIKDLLQNIINYQDLQRITITIITINNHKHINTHVYLGKPKIWGKTQLNEISLALATTLTNPAK